MSVASLRGDGAPPPQIDLVPIHFETDLIVSPPDNPAYGEATVTDLLESFRRHGQLVPGWVAPSTGLPETQRLCLEGNRRLTAARLLGIPFWAFDAGRVVPEEERIVLSLHHNYSRRVMSREEIAERAARYMEISGATAEAAARVLNISAPTLSRAFGQRRIPAPLRARTETLGLSVRSLIAALSTDRMAEAVGYAETIDATTGRPPTRDAVAAFIQKHLKNGGGRRARRPATVTLKHGGRSVSFSLADGDTAFSVADDLKEIAGKLAKINKPPEAWPHHFD